MFLYLRLITLCKKHVYRDIIFMILACLCFPLKSRGRGTLYCEMNMNNNRWGAPDVINVFNFVKVIKSLLFYFEQSCGSCKVSIILQAYEFGQYLFTFYDDNIWLCIALLNLSLIANGDMMASMEHHHFISRCHSEHSTNLCKFCFTLLDGENGLFY
jgi:hypothetical protein